MSQRRDQFVGRVAINQRVCRDHYRLVLRLAQFPSTCPGQFIQVCCRSVAHAEAMEVEREWQPGRPMAGFGEELAGRLALLRRPFSLAGRRDTREGVELELIHRVVGTGTAWLSRLRPSDEVGILGPLGNTFTLPGPDAAALLVGGGVGIPPMLYLAERLAGRKAVAFCGALERDLLPFTLTEAPGAASPDSVEPRLSVAEFARHGIPAVITTDDGSYGFRGYVTQALETYLEGLGFGVDGPGEKARPRPDAAALRPVIYTCGPEPMMKRVAEISLARGLECQVAVERAMACGMGTCQSCVIRVRRKSDDPAMRGKDWVYKLACTDGPVFQAADLLW